MRLTFTFEEYELLRDTLSKHNEQDLKELIHKKFKESMPSKEAYSNKQEAAIKARQKVERKNDKKIDIAIQELSRRKEKITVTSVSKEAGIAYNTANKYKVRITFAEADRNRKLKDK